MALVRMIFVNVGPDRAAEAERVWKEECAPLMIKQQGCLSEELLKALTAPGEYISYAVWENQECIDRYLASDAHREIKSHGARLAVLEPPVVKEYELV